MTTLNRQVTPGVGYGTTGAVAHRPILVTLALLSLMMPFSFQVGTLTLTMSRILFTIILVPLLINLLSGKYGKILAMDVLVLLYMAWRTITTFITSAPVALEYSASNAAIFLGAYLVARASVRSVESFFWAAKLLILFTVISLPFAIYEAKTSVMVIPRMLDGIPGITPAADVNYEPRKGLYRVQYVFTHPIHYGLFASVPFALLFVAMRRRLSLLLRAIGGGIIIVCCFLSVSSGPFLALLVQVAFASYDWIFRQIKARWKIMIWGGLILYIILEIASNRPAFYAISSRLAFNASTANDRKLLLEYGLAQVWRTPVLGLGFHRLILPPWMTGSMDNFWLADAVTWGIPAFLFHFGAFVSAIVGIGRRAFPLNSDLNNIRYAWIFVMISLTLTMATVYIWSEIASLVFFVFGAGAFLLTVPSDGSHDEPADAKPDGRRSLRYTRFSADGRSNDHTASKALTQKPNQ